jgi:hypothetical protein
MKKAEAERIEKIMREFLINPDVGLTFFKTGIMVLTIYGVHKDNLNNIIHLCSFKQYHKKTYLWIHDTTFFSWFNDGVFDALELMGVDSNKKYYEYRNRMND